MGTKYASNAERQKAYRDRKRNAGSVTRSTQEEVRTFYGGEFSYVVQQRLAAIEATYSIGAANAAAEAIRAALAEERSWAGVLAGVRETVEGEKLRRLISRNDPTWAQFCRDVGLTFERHEAPLAFRKL